MSATVLGGNSCVLSFRKGAAALEAVRLASAFFGKGQFVGERLAVENGACVLTQSLTGPYYQPLSPEARPPDGAWDPADPRRPRTGCRPGRPRSWCRDPRVAFESALAWPEPAPCPPGTDSASRRGGALSRLATLREPPDAFLLREGTGEYRLGPRVVPLRPRRAPRTWTPFRAALRQLDTLSVSPRRFSPFPARLPVASPASQSAQDSLLTRSGTSSNGANYGF